LEVGPGDSIVVTKLPHGRVELQSAHSKGKIADIFGLLKQDRTPLTVEDMNRIAARGWAGKR
jgi:hypothetical protein